MLQGGLRILDLNDVPFDTNEDVAMSKMQQQTLIQAGLLQVQTQLRLHRMKMMMRLCHSPMILKLACAMTHWKELKNTTMHMQHVLVFQSR